MRLHLLDATYELFRAFFGGGPDRQAPDGREVKGVVGLIESTLSLLRQPDVTHLAAATDQVIRSFRNDLFDGYKTGEGLDPEILAQFPLAERALEALGVVVWKMEEFEADDALATAAWRFSDDVDRVVILTPDKDLAQCVVGDRVVMFDRRREIVIDEDGVWEKWGVGPESIPDYLGLVGDTADGYPGVPSWGAKSASTLLARYVHLDRIPADAEEWDVKVRGAERLAANLRDHRAEAALYRQLATLRLDVPLTESLEDLEWRGVPRAAYLEFCDELGFNEVKNRPHRWVE
ncbi:MAG: 5'-3' exonuclease H3TH domain-containing protein [Acidimicrobiia bacterium]|nr:5'-3' exonuclease H3TH domain-containing protein [Acidimicrobiia bacterium]